MFVHDGFCNMSEWFYFTTEAIAGGTIYQETIRNDGVDYFTYLGGNITASDFAVNITGFDEPNEYIAIWDNGTYDAINGNWKLYYGDGTGTDFTFTTFMICKINLTDAGTQVINMTANSNMNYTNSKTIPLRNLTSNKGYNFTSKNTYGMTTLSAINTSIGLDVGEALWLWNQTNYEWDIWIPYFGFTDKNVYRWDVIQTKVENSEQWVT